MFQTDINELHLQTICENYVIILPRLKLNNVLVASTPHFDHILNVVQFCTAQL